MRKLPKDVLKMASGLISPSGLAGHRRPLCNGPFGFVVEMLGWYRYNLFFATLTQIDTLDVIATAAVFAVV